MADRFQYLAGIGVISSFHRRLGVHGASRLSGGLKLGTTGLLVVLLALLGTRTWRQAGIYRDEVTFFSHIVSLNPKARSAHYNLSSALTRAGRPEEALAAARMAVENRPGQAKDLSVLGAALIRTERFVEAEEVLRRALEIDPGHKYSRRQIALMLREQGRDEEALEAYRALLEIDSNYAPAYAYIGDILVQLHRYAEAVEPLSKALTLINAARSLTADLPPPGFVHELLGTALRELGRPQSGEAHFRRALQLNPRNMKELKQLARSHFRRKRYRQALELYRTLLENDPDVASTHANIGTTLYYLDRSEEAIQSLERALALDPSLDSARTNLEKIRKRVRQLEE